ncbi:hypothetical protein [Paludibacterium denitrificans]|nr:hypothetical protein [Paludibacterium denitrificans]
MAPISRALKSGAQADRALGKDHDDIANLDIGIFRALETGGHDVRAH